MDDDGLLLSIGELARRSGLPVRTVRFWSDAGVLPPAERTDSGRRLSYVDSVSFGVTADYESASDLDVVTEGIQRGLWEPCCRLSVWLRPQCRGYGSLEDCADDTAALLGQIGPAADIVERVLRQAAEEQPELEALRP